MRLDEIYDLVESNIDGEIRAKIRRIPDQVDHPLAGSVAKSICLLQFVQSVHRTAENIAACLYPSLGAPSELESVKEALQVLEHANLVRKGDDGYRIPTPAEDDWDRLRNGTAPKPSDAKRLHREILTGFWKPQPTFTLDGVKPFRAGLAIDGHEEEKGDLMVHSPWPKRAKPSTSSTAELRARSQQETDAIFWAVPLSDAIDRETVELFRSRDMDARKGRDARTPDQARLLAEEKARARRHQSELQRLLRAACLNGSAYFRGNDRSPSSGAGDVAKAATIDPQPGAARRLHPLRRWRRQVHRRQAWPRRTDDRDRSARPAVGLPGPAICCVMRAARPSSTPRTTPRCATYSPRSKRAPTSAARRPASHSPSTSPTPPTAGTSRSSGSSWPPSCAAGKIQMTHKGDAVDDPKSVAGKDGLGNNNHFKAASFQPKKGVDFEEFIKANQHFKATFGSEIRELSESAVANAIRAAVDGCRDDVQAARDLLAANRLPGIDVLDDAVAEAKAIARGTEGDAIADLQLVPRETQGRHQARQPSSSSTSPPTL